MERIFKILIFTDIIFFSFSLVPLWNFENSTINLLSDINEYEYYITDQTIHDNFNYKLKKKIGKNNDKITITNYLIFDYGGNNINQEISFEEIQSAYTDKNGRYYICPKGRHHIYYLYPNGNINGKELKPDNFIDTGDWELNCYLQYTQNVLKKLFVFYLNKEEEYIYTVNDLSSGEIKKIGDNKFNILSFRWTTSGSNNIYPMYAIIADKTHVVIERLDFSIYTGSNVQSRISIMGNNTLMKIPKSNFKAFLNLDNVNNKFYYISYDIDNVNISTGYGSTISEFKNYDPFDIKHNSKSPLEFFDKVKIENISFIPYTQYVYYKSHNLDKKKYYYGIIDILINKAIYHTDEEIIAFIPYSSYSMLAVTSNSAYEICSIYYEGKCTSSCYYSLFYDTDNYNHCTNSYTCKYYKLIPNEICINDCDQNYFYLDEKNNCGLCKDYDINKPYKMIKSKVCLEEKIENSFYVNEELLIISCIDNYTFNESNNQCELNCYSSCESCLKKSNNHSEQQCLTCKDSFPLLYNTNCLDKCPNKTYQDNNACFDCQESCISCDKTGCNNCYEGNYLNNDTHRCEKCHENCQTCFKGGNNLNNNCIKCKNESDILSEGTCLKNCGETQFRTTGNSCEQCHDNCAKCEKGGNDKNNNCLSCKNNLFFVKGGEYDNNCVDSCPENTEKNDKEKICTYLENSGFNWDILRYIFIIGIAVALIIINIIFFCKYCCKKEDDVNLEKIDELNNIIESDSGIN